MCSREAGAHREELAVVENFSPGRRKNLGGIQKGREEGQTSALPCRQLGLRAPSGAFQQSDPHWAPELEKVGEVGTELGLALMDPVESFDCTVLSLPVLSGLELSEQV